MKKRLVYLAMPVLMCSLLCSCATYHLAPGDLVNQIRAAHQNELNVTHSSPMIPSQRYNGNGVKELICYDKHEKKTSLRITPAIEMRITDTNGHRHIFYFDTVNLEDSVLVGMNSRILSTKRRLSIANMRKVEVQNGGKAYQYK